MYRLSLLDPVAIILPPNLIVQAYRLGSTSNPFRVMVDTDNKFSFPVIEIFVRLLVPVVLTILVP